jgi:hypothetical protein
MVGDSRNRTVGEAVCRRADACGATSSNPLVDAGCNLGRRHGTHGRRPSLRGVRHHGCAQCGAVALARPNGHLLTIPSECTRNEFCRFWEAVRIAVVGTDRGARNIHHLKGFGICVRHNRGAIGAGGIHAAILCVLKCWCHLFPSNHRTFMEKE